MDCEGTPAPKLTDEEWKRIDEKVMAIPKCQAEARKAVLERSRDCASCRGSVGLCLHCEEWVHGCDLVTATACGPCDVICHACSATKKPCPHEGKEYTRFWRQKR